MNIYSFNNITIVIERSHKSVKSLVVYVQFLSKLDRKLVVAIENFSLTSRKTVSSSDGTARAVTNLVGRFLRACLAVLKLHALLAILVFAAHRVQSIDWLASSVVVELITADKAVATV